MSCYLPLVQRWRKPPTPQNPTKEQPKKAAARQQAEEPTGLEPDMPTEVEARRDNRGVTLSQKVGDVTLHIRHDNPQLGLNDVAYQRLHQEHTRKKKSRDDSSLTLPLGISSLRLASKLRGPSRGCESETEGRRGKLAVSQFYQALAGSTATISQQELVREYREEGQGRARRAKMPSVLPKQPRPSSVDADLLMGSRSYGRKEGRKLKYAALTSPSSYMRQGQEKDEKSSSGNSSGSDITSEGSPHPVSEEGEPLHPALRGRTPAPLTGIGRPPPPRHLLPARLRPSPLVKLHPVLVLPPSLRQELETGGQESSSDAEVVELSREDRPGSPFGRSRHTTPHCSQRRQRRSKSCNPGGPCEPPERPSPASLTPSPLDLGYQTLEHSFCETGDSSIDSPMRDPRLEPGVTRGLERSGPCHILRLPQTLILKLLSFLNSKELARVSATCKQLRQLCWSENLWTSIVLAGESLDTDRAVRAILSRLVWAREGRDGAPGVTTVVLSGCARLTDRSLTLLGKNCPSLQHLEVARCRNVTNGGVLELVTRCTELLHLDLTGCPMVSSVNCAVRRGGSPSLALTHLDMSECQGLEDQGLLRLLANCPAISHLYLRKCSGVTECLRELKLTDVGVKAISVSCPQLRELSLSDCPQLTDHGLWQLARLGPSLRYLSVAKCSQISDQGLHQVATLCYKLRYLNLRGCHLITDVSLASLAASCCRLRSLDLGKCSITDTGLAALGRALLGLRKLSVRGCHHVGEAGLLALAASCPALQHLNVAEVDGLSRAALRGLATLCRNCSIET